MTEELLRVERLAKRFSVGRRELHAVSDVTFEVGAREVVGLVGESGSGKSTLGRSILRLIEPSAGRVIFKGTDLTQLGAKQLRAFRRDMQMIFQDPFASLNGRMKVREIVGEAFRIHDIARGRAREAKVAELLERVGLSPEHMSRYPHQFSGGQRQRIGIARALAVSPSFIVADEPVSALDVSVQAQVLNLLRDLQRELGLALLFISHDLAVVQFLCDRVLVMYLGRLMEIAQSRSLYTNPKHPYTEALLSAIPSVKPDAKRSRILLKGDAPSPLDPPSGCVFRTRCRYAIPECSRTVPELREVSPGHFKACIRDVL